MKKQLIGILTLLTVILFACNDTSAQGISMYRNTDTTSSGVATAATITSGTSDTLYDANTLYSFYTKVGALNATAASKYLITFNATKTSGTGTAKVFIQGSTDGKVWRNLNGGMLGTDGLNSDTLNIAAATTTPGVNYSYYSFDGHAVLRPASSAAVYYVNSGRVYYLRAKIIGAGTQQTIYSNFKVITYQ